MATQRAGVSIQQTGTTMKRRGILAAAGAIVAGIVAKQMSQPVAATSGGGDQGPLNLGSNPWYVAGIPLGANSPAVSSAPTVIQASPNFGNFAGANGADSVVFEVDARPSGGSINGINSFATGNGGIGVYTSGPYVGVWGTGSTGIYGNGTSTGVLGSGSTGVSGSGGTTGVSGSGSTTGVTGTGGPTGVSGTGSTTGVSGTGGPTGVRGVGTTTGVHGQIPSSASTANTMAVRAENLATGPSGIGVYATSAKWHGVYAECGTDQGAGALVGVTNVATGVAFQARANSPAIAAGFFVGNVSVFGSLGVSGGKFAVVKSSDGKYRAMHAVEAPEAWFEDFGKAKLVSGKADVRIDPLFAQHIRTDDYHVFLTSYDPACKGLGVVTQRVDGFAVQELNGGSSGGAFSWRVVGKRADLKDERMPVWEMPPGADLPATPPPPPVSTAPQPAPPSRPVTPPPVPETAAPQSGTSTPPVQPAPPPRP
jgi:hypothetical protein